MKLKYPKVRALIVKTHGGNGILTSSEARGLLDLRILRRRKEVFK